MSKCHLYAFKFSVGVTVLLVQCMALSAPGLLPSCEWRGADEAPDSLSWQISIAPPDEPGDSLIVTGTVYRPDGRTPAPGVILYVYHTNAQGIYPKKGDETGNGRRHGYLRG